ncbi:MAG: hypothetical protein AAGG51_24360 [Cyanobacteria bacterium P01_G01_bin.54]
MLIPNWLVGWAGLLLLALFYNVWILKKKTLIQERFGEAYGDDRQTVVAIVPWRLGKGSISSGSADIQRGIVTNSSQKPCGTNRNTP